MAVCKHCGKGPHQGITLVRVNETGVVGIWECAPSCKTTFINNRSALLFALNRKSK